MWPFDNVPAADFEARYGFAPSQEWLDHLRLSSAKFGGGCSSSFVSGRGLILTNHHCARGNIASASPEGQDWLRDGYIASSLEAEVPLEGLEVRQVVGMRDVTAEMNAGLEDGDQQTVLARNRAAILAAARETDADHEHELVSLYQGGVYHVYSYRVFDDIRLVATPQMQAAKFGGDPDNFTFPRYSLDFTLVRAWEDGKPADTSAHYLKFKTAGPAEGEAVFVSGNPGSTGRLETIAQMEFRRDVEYPATLERIHAMLDRMPEDAGDARAVAQRLSLENARKAYTGYLDGLRNENVMQIKRDAEAAVRAAVAANPTLQEKYGDAWTNLEQICAQKAEAFAAGGDGMRELRQREAVESKRIGEAFFAVYGTAIPPDATLTLRLSDGVVKGFPMNGTIAPWFTSTYGLYARHTEFGGESPFDLPKEWLEARDKLDLTTPFNYVSTCDIIGGNSGSPIVDREGHLVGLVFDGNIESLGNRFVYTDEVARTVAVHPAIIVESLRKVYDAGAIADELEGVAGF